MKKLLLLICAFFFCAIVTNAQNYEDVVYFKNGSIIRGIIIEQVPYESLKIQTKDGSVFVVDIDDVQKMTKELPFSERNNDKKFRSKAEIKFNKPRGYFGLVQLGLAPSVNGYESLRVGATIINGYRVLPQFAIGVGIGLQFYPIDASEVTLPIFAHLRSDFLNGKVSPFLAFNVGYNVSLSGGFYGGLMLEPTLGISFNVGKKYRMSAGLGLACDRVKYYIYDKYNTYTLKDWALALNVKVGFSF